MAFSFNIPRQIIPGDTLTWTDSFVGYSPQSHALTWAIRGASAIDLIAVAGAENFATTLTAIQSATLIPGAYFWQAMLTDSGGRFTIGQGQLQIFTNLSALTGTYDGKSINQKLLESVEAALIARLENGQISEYEIKGRKLKYMDLSELRLLRDQLRAQLAREQAVLGNGNSRLFIRFGRPGR